MKKNQTLPSNLGNQNSDSNDKSKRVRLTPPNIGKSLTFEDQINQANLIAKKDSKNTTMPNLTSERYVANNSLRETRSQSVRMEGISSNQNSDQMDNDVKKASDGSKNHEGSSSSPDPKEEEPKAPAKPNAYQRDDEDEFFQDENFDEENSEEEEKSPQDTKRLHRPSKRLFANVSGGFLPRHKEKEIRLSGLTRTRCVGGGNPKHKRANYSKEVTGLLNGWLKNHMHYPYPGEEERQELCRATGLTRKQLRVWFINSRKKAKSHLNDVNKREQKAADRTAENHHEMLSRKQRIGQQRIITRC
eukprot:CAMPEP_0168340776 /NCGR_PEP_ID=MMETSP0213-20121227/14271_1 /TAXON_ID=151035 /ORGANISM="Euplotes harpa, Strain FSP1.4" /LENGTH=302 /DNA_ID=CAMNT_0008347089 /DNA_START=1 /DNA_END=909 /DNA_ORIENTATION=+